MRRIIGCLVALLLVGAVALDGLYGPWAAVGAAALVGLCLPVLQRAPLRLHRLEWMGGGLMLTGALVSLGRAVQPSMAVWGPPLVLAGLVGLLGGRVIQQRGAVGILLQPLGLLPLGLVLHGLWLLSTGVVHQSGRLAGALGYPIALGATGLIGLSAALPLAGGAGWRKGLWGAALYGGTLALFLSGSRGLWAAAGVTLLLLLAGRPGWCERLWLPLLGGGAVGLWVAPLVAGRAPLPAALWTVAGALFTGLGAVWLDGVEEAGLDRVAEEWGPTPTLRTRRLRGLSLGLVLIATMVWAPGWAWLTGRAQLPGTETASVERLTFLRDAWPLVWQHPLGQGFRAWASLQLTAASYPYWVGEVHSALMDAMLNWGWLGGLGLCLILARLWWGGWRLRTGPDGPFALVIGVGGIALHGLVDWTLSYGLFAGLVALGLGLLPASAPRALAIPRQAVAVIVGLLAAIALLLGAGEWAASSARDALRAGDPGRALSQADLAERLAPWHEEGWAVAGEATLALGRPREALPALDRAVTLAPLEPWYRGQRAEVLFALNDEAGGLAAYREMVERQPWAPEAYDRALAAHLERYLSATLRGDNRSAALARDGGRLLLARLATQRAKVPPGAPRQWHEPDSAVIRRAQDLFR
jgi:tetratricopeptide (TPR) repeat protein